MKDPGEPSVQPGSESAPATSGRPRMQRLYPATNGVTRAHILSFAAGARLRFGEWQQLKWLYKQAEAAHDMELLGTLIGRLDAAPFPVDDEALPSAATLAYMKRRA